jgi:hypothetical protein
MEVRLYLQVSSSLVLVSEYTGGLNDIVGTSLSPWDFFRVPDAKDSNCLLAEEESLVVLELDVAVLPVAVDSVVLEHVGHVLGCDEGVVDGDELDILALEGDPGDEPPDPSETVDSDLNLSCTRPKSSKEKYQLDDEEAKN